MDQDKHTHTSPLALLSICLGFFMTILDITIVNIALPSLKDSFSEGITGLQWAIDAYTLTFSCFLLVAGYLSDSLGARRVFLWGVTTFAIFSVLCGSVSSIQLLILFRLFQGIASALIIPSSLALINLLYTEKAKVAKAIGIWAGVGGLASSSGIILGAFLTTYFGWRSIFFINFPVGVITVWLTCKYVPQLFRTLLNRYSFDWLGQLIGLIATSSLAFALIESGRVGLESAQVLISILLFFCSLIFYIKIEKIQKHPMIPLAIFKNYRFSVPVLIGMALNISFYGILFVLPLYLTGVVKYSMLVSGLTLLPLTIWSILSSYLSGKVTSKIGARLPMLIGLLIASIGYLSLLLLTEQKPPYLLFLFQLSVICLGYTFTLPAATISVVQAVSVEDTGVAASILNLSRQIGSLVGVALFGTIINRAQDFVSGMHSTFLIATLVLFIGILLVMGLFRKGDAKKFN